MRRRLRKGGDSINSFMAWVGGKKALRDEILARFPRNYKRYIEVFGGAGWVLFHKKCTCSKLSKCRNQFVSYLLFHRFTS